MCLGVQTVWVGHAPLFWCQLIYQSVQCTPGHTHKGCSIPLSPQLHVVLHGTEEAGNLPRQQANTVDVFDQHSAKAAVFCLDIRQEIDWGGLQFGLWGSHHRVEGTSCLLETILVFPESGLEERQLIMEAFLVTHCPKVARMACMLEGRWCDSRVQAEVCVGRFSEDLVDPSSVEFLANKYWRFNYI
jgi:hypothetical protein